jgi:hypothetical protein
MQFYCGTCEYKERDYDINPNLFYVIKKTDIKTIHNQVEDPKWAPLEKIYFDRVLFSISGIIDLHLWRCPSCEGLYIFYRKDEDSTVSYELLSGDKIPYFTDTTNGESTYKNFPSSYSPDAITCTCGNDKVKDRYVDNWLYKFCSWVKKGYACEKYDEEGSCVANLTDDKVLPFFLDMSFNVYECQDCKNLIITGLNEKDSKFMSVYKLLKGKAP